MTDDKNHSHPEEDPLFDKGADWFVKKDRGLTESEKEGFEKDLLESPALEDELILFEETRKLVGQLPSDFVSDMLAEEETRAARFPFAAVVLSIAAVLLLGLSVLFWGMRAGAPDGEAVQTLVDSQSAPKTHLLPDGSLIRLNVGSEVEIAFGKSTRRINLNRGEALFEVSPDPERPFIVEVDGVHIRAVGTAFNVKRSESIDVIVTHGIVEIAAPARYAGSGREASQDHPPAASEKFVAVGQRARVLSASGRPNSVIEVFDIEDDELEIELDWRKSMLALSGESLVEMASSFEQKTGYRLLIADPALKKLRIGGRFPSNDVFGFLRILEAGYGIQWKKTDDGIIVLGESN